MPIFSFYTKMISRKSNVIQQTKAPTYVGWLSNLLTLKSLARTKEYKQHVNIQPYIITLFSLLSTNLRKLFRDPLQLQFRVSSSSPQLLKYAVIGELTTR